MGMERYSIPLRGIKDYINFRGPPKGVHVDQMQLKAGCIIQTLGEAHRGTKGAEGPQRGPEGLRGPDKDL